MSLTRRERAANSISRDQAAAIGALGTLAAALIEGGRIGWSDPRVIAAFCAGVILTVLFLVQERRAEEPVLPLSLFRRPLFARTSLIGLLVNIPFYGLIFVFSLYFQKVDGLSPLRTGLAFVPMMAIILPGNLLAPRLADRFGGPAIAGGALISAAGCLALLGIEPGTSYPKSGSWVIATMGRIGAFDGHEHNCFDAFTSPGG
jgi:DHA2 family methylenomycin A resistance protein-like MFS transporter